MRVVPIPIGCVLSSDEQLVNEGGSYTYRMCVSSDEQLVNEWWFLYL